MQASRVLIVDDHQLVRDGLALLLSTFEELIIVGTATDGEEAVELYRTVQPDVVLMDLVMPVLDGPAAIARIRADDSQARIIVLTSFVEDDLVQRAIAAGAIGYLLKNASPEQLAEAIRAAHVGQSTINAQAAQALLRTAATDPRSDYGLTAREQDILLCLIEGKTNKEIGATLFLSPTTVRDHVSHILAKLGVNNRTEAATLALKKGILPE